eukprot:COSAG04_NODE_2988_length_3309_cov_1.989720_2_plen_299_part_00
MVWLLTFLFGFGFFVYLVPALLVYLTVLINIVSSLAYVCRHGIALNMLTAGAACNATRLLYLGVHTARAARVHVLIIASLLILCALPTAAAPGSLDFGSPVPMETADNPLAAPAPDDAPAATNGVFGALLGAAQAAASIVTQPQRRQMKFTALPSAIPTKAAANAQPYARSGGALPWAQIPTEFGTTLEVRWYDGHLFAKVTAATISPLGPFIEVDGEHRNAARKRREAVNTQGYYCEAHPRMDKESCVMEWPALQWLLSQRNRTSESGERHKSPCVPATQHDAAELHTWRQWADMVR